MILVSILLAFGINAWWDRSSERRVQEELVSALVADFTALRDDIDKAILRADTIAEANLSFIRAAVTGMESIPIDTLDSWFSSIGRPVPIQLETPALEAVIATGSLELTRDAALRGALVDFRDARQQYQLMLQATSDAVLAGPEMAALRSATGGTITLRTRPASDRRAFYGTKEASAAMEVLFFITNNIRNMLGDARAVIDVILERLEERRSE